MIAEANAGNAAFQANIADGHHLIYLADVDYLHEHQDRIEAGIITQK